MKDTTIKNNGKAFNIKAPEDMPETFEEWREQAIAGNAFLDVSLNTSTGPDAGCDVVGTPQNKATLLDDTTKAALELKQADPTVNDALYTLSQKSQPAEVHVLAAANQVVTMTLGNKTLSAQANASGWAILYPATFGDWTVKAGNTSKTFTLDAIAVYYFPMATLEELSWAQISAVSKSGLAPKLWNIGDTKSLQINGESHTAIIIGFDHDDVTNAGAYGRAKAGITWQLKDCLATTYQMESSNTNVNGWDGCAMRKTHLGVTIMGQIPAALKSVLVAVNKLASAGNQSATIKTSSDQLFLLSEIEIFGKLTSSKAGEGEQYEWYRAGNPTIKNRNGSAYYWWERSPYGSNATNFCIVNSYGNAGSYNASLSYGVAFGFCV